MRVISGTAKGTKLNSIEELSTRPTLDRVKEALFNIILVVPLIIICGIALQIGLKISILNLIIMMIIPCLTAVLISYAGVLVNLWFPKLEYENENTLLKQSTSAVIMMFAGIFLIFSLIGLSIWLLFCNLSFIVVAIILISILLIITALVIALSYTVGQRIFNHL